MSSHLLPEMDKVADHVVIAHHDAVVHASPMTQLGLDADDRPSRRLKDMFIDLTHSGEDQAIEEMAT